MHIFIDIVATIILLFFFLAGWHKGFLLSVLGVGRVVLAYSAAYFSGRYLGYWLGEIAHRPRIITIPVCAGLAFILVFFAFYLVMSRIREEHAQKKAKENFHHPLISGVCGGGVNLAAGLLSLILVFWLGDLFLVGIAGVPIPGSNKAHFSRFARNTVYKGVYFALPKQGREPQVASMAHMVSNPADALRILERVLTSDSVQQAATDPQWVKDVLSGDPDRIQANASMQGVLNDRETLEELRELGLLSGSETRTGLCRKLATFGANETIQSSLESLRERGLLSADKIPRLLRDPAFDAILAELLKQL